MDKPQPLVEHLAELRKRLIYCLGLFLFFFCVSYYYSQELFDFLVQPLANVLHNKGEQRRLIYTSLTEAFTTYIRVSIFFATLATFPFLAFQVWKFVVPGLYEQERFVFRSFLLSTPLFFISGALFAYYVIFPAAYTFFLNFENVHSSLPIQLEAKLNEYLSFVMRLIMAFGVCFELPVLLSLLALGGFIKVDSLKKHWRIAVVVIFSVSAIATPPDVLSMLGLAIPLLFLYGLSLKMIQIIELKKK